MVQFRFERPRSERQLRASEDVEVVVRRVSARVSFGADGCAEDDEIFGYAFWGGVKLDYFSLFKESTAFSSLSLSLI